MPEVEGAGWGAKWEPGRGQRSMEESITMEEEERKKRVENWPEGRTAMRGRLRTRVGMEEEGMSSMGLGREVGESWQQC